MTSPAVESGDKSPHSITDHGKDARVTRPSSLVVFGAGYVGQAVVREGLTRGWRVTALTRNAEKARALESLGAEIVVDELASDAWHTKIARADFVVNCVSAGGGGVDGYRRSYVDGMKSVLAWMENARVTGCSAKGFVYTSSTSVYPQSGGCVVCESDEAGGDERAQLLVAAEQLALAGGACVLRLAGIYGPGRHLLLNQVREGAREIAGRGDYRLNLIHRDDAAGAILAALVHAEARGEIFNVCNDFSATRAEVVAWLAERTGAAMPNFTGAAASGRRAVLLDRIISNEKIKAQLGWRPRYTSFREGYEALC